MVYRQLIKDLKKVVKSLGFETTDVVLSIQPNQNFGDYSTNVALQLAKQKTRNIYHSPKDIANNILKELKTPEYLERAEIAGAGFVNFFIKREELVQDLEEIDEKFLRINLGENQKVLLEHTSVNPNKAMHVGHLRNAVIGDSLARILRKCGFRVEVQNYIDDTGTQVVDTYIGLKHLSKIPFRQKKENEPLDDYYWQVYAAVNRKYEEDPNFKFYKDEVAKALEDQPQAQVTKEVKEMVAVEMVECIKRTLLDRFGIVHDIYIWESDILKSGLWKQAFEILKVTPGFEHPIDGKNAGTWLVQFGKSDETHDQSKIFVKSDGTTTYIAKDFAYNLWKFGLLPDDFKYREWDFIKSIDHTIYTSDVENGETSQNFGKGDFVYTLIDERQSYLQQVLVEVFKRLGYDRQALNFKHIAYGVVSLSPKTAQALGAMLDSTDKHSYAMSGRKGVGVEVKSLHELMILKLNEEKREKIQTQNQTRQKGETIKASAIAAAAIKYFMLKFNSGTEIVFDFDQALSIYGATGPYLQYTFARVCGILEKAKDISWSKSDYFPNTDELDLIKKILDWPNILEGAAKDLEPSKVANFCFELAQSFNSFYEKNRIIGEASSETQIFRKKLVEKFQIVFEDVLDSLGIEAPERM